HPKIADYPFTTLYPSLGVVSVGPLSSFVMADIPGLIEGAAEGAGLGIRFLKHLARTHLLLHMVDVSPYSDSGDPVNDVRAIEHELTQYDAELGQRERWLVLNKIDLLPEEERAQRQQDIITELDWQGPVFAISAAQQLATRELCNAIMRWLEQERSEQQPLQLPDGRYAESPPDTSTGNDAE
ncbi:MAG: 50S ribosome-binding GTPase, partial [Candidatus Competibacteraceae bacterium]|nr:50S ribosome-binding GTPase [Candidatus Competibacteraceae bacterium]